MKMRYLHALLFVFASTLVQVGYAEEITVPETESTSAWDGKTPTRGQSKDHVYSQFGEPDSINGPSGEPPIYYWEYPDFTVYFESDYVIHSVVKSRGEI